MIHIIWFVMHPETQVFFGFYFLFLLQWWATLIGPTIKNILKLNYFTMQKYNNLQKKTSTRNQNPSGWLELYN
jgi:hypothetical protein